MAEAHREEIAKLEALYAAHPEGRVFTHLAEAYRRAGQLDRAREILEDGLRRHPDYSSAHVVFGRVQMDRGETDGAAAAFRRVLELDRHNLVALRSLGDLAVRAGDNAAAVGYYRDLIALDPTDDRLRLAVSRLEEALAARGVADEATPAEEPAAAAEAVSTGAAEVEDVAAEPMPSEVGSEPGWSEAEPAGEAEPEWTGAADDSLIEPEPGPPEEAVSVPDLGRYGADEAEPEEPAISFPSLEGTDLDESTFVYGEGTLDVEGLTLGWAESEEEAERPGGALDEETVTPVDAVFEEPGSVPDAFAGMGWQAGDSGVDMTGEEPEDDTAPVGDEAIIADDDDSWTSVGERAAAAWGGEAPEPEAPDHVEEIRTWGPLPDGEEGAPEEPGPAPVGGTAESALDLGEPLAEEAGAELEVVEEPEPITRPSGSGDVVTATMAELYAQQGFYDRSIDVYRQLLEQVPEDERLRDRLSELEALNVAATDSEDSAAEAASVWTGAGGVAGGEETPYAWSDTAGDEAGASATTAGDYFRSLLGWRPSVPDEPEPVATLDLTEEHALAEEEPVEPAEPPLEAGAVEAQLEEWFGDSSEDRGEGGADSADDEAAEEDADLAMFRSWLQSLKK